MNARPFAWIALGFAWLATGLYIIVGNIILRETPLGVLAATLDGLPSSIASPVFCFLWATLLLGWQVPLAVGVWLLLKRRPLPN